MVSRLKASGRATFTFPLFHGTPLPYQAVGAEIAYRAKKLLLMDATGLGKTIQALLLISKLIEDRRAGRRKSLRALISVESDTVLQWRNELRRFLDLDALMPLGEKKAREARYDVIAARDEAVVIINHSKLFVDFDNIVNKLRPDVFIVDEAAVLSNPNKTHKFATWVAKRTDFTLLMSAEPISRGDLVQIRNCFLVMGLPLCDSEEEFIDRFVVTEEKTIWAKGRFGPFKRKIVTPKGAKNLDEFKALISPNALRRPESVLGETRIINRQLVSVDMTPLQRERYAEITKKIKTARNERTSIDAISTAGYISQILCSPHLVDSSAPPESPKAEALARLALKLAPEKLVVFSKWKVMHKILGEEFRKKKISALFYSGDLERGQRNDAIETFRNDPAVQVLVLTQAGQRGLNIQVARNLVILDLLHSPASMRQLLGRVNRIGQTSKVINFYMLVCNDSSEMNIMRVLKDRQSVIDAAFDDEKSQLFDDNFTPEELYLDI